MGVFGGDLVEKSGDVQDWTEFFAAGQPVFSEIPMAAVPGNHETSVIPYTYLQMMEVPQNGIPKGEVYSFEYGSCHFIMLNSCLFMDERIKEMGKKEWNSMMEDVERWMKKDLSASRAKWKIAVMHHPPYPAAEDDEIYSRIRDRWMPVLESRKLDLVLCGHQHVYLRTKEINGVTCIMGNSGKKESRYYREGEELPDYVEKLADKTETYQILTVTDGELAAKSYDQNGNLLDSWSRKK